MIGLLGLVGNLLAFWSRRPAPAAETETFHLVEPALSGEPAAARALAERLLPVIRRQALAALRRGRTPPTPVEADDLTQDVWLHLWEDGGRRLRAHDRGLGGSFEGYVAVTAARAIGHLLEKGRAQRRGGHLRAVELDEERPLAASTPDPERALLGADAAARLHAAVRAELSPKGQLVFQCLYVDGRSVEETARILGANTQVVYNWQHRIRQVARERLSP